jgi:hypothetical protein
MKTCGNLFPGYTVLIENGFYGPIQSLGFGSFPGNSGIRGELP